MIPVWAAEVNHHIHEHWKPKVFLGHRRWQSGQPSHLPSVLEVEMASGLAQAIARENVSGSIPPSQGWGVISQFIVFYDSLIRTIYLLTQLPVCAAYLSTQ